jgi:nicotinamide-nucleotide amidase
VISYDNSVKANILGVQQSDLYTAGAVSKSVAMQMAVGVRSLLSTNWGISITGIAGPSGGTHIKPVGLVYIGLAEPDGSVECFKYQLGQNRSRSSIRHISACNALDQLRRKLLARGNSLNHLRR